MPLFRNYLSILILVSLVSCSNADNTLDSDIFYSNFKSDFLKSDLTKYDYDPRGHFTPSKFDSSTFYRVLIMRDSSLKIMGVPLFSKVFSLKIDTFFTSDVILSRLSDNKYTLKSSNAEEALTHIIPTQASSINIVDYFLSLKRLLDKFKILEIASHPGVNTKTIVFSSNDYLIYKPDILVFNNPEDTSFMKYLFNNGRQLDKNWYQFKDTISTDYQ